MNLFKFISSTDPTVLTQGGMIQDPTSIMWAERYNTPGEFEIVAPLSSGLREFLPFGALVSHTNTYEVMFVENQEISEDANEDPTIKITGRSLEAYLENRIVGMDAMRSNPLITQYVLPPWYTFDQITKIINEHIGSTAYPNDNLVNVQATSIVGGTGVVETRVVKPTHVHQAVLDLLAIEDLGIKVIRRNPFGVPGGSDTYTALCVHKGADKSSSVIFSWKSGDLDQAGYLWSDKVNKNSAAVIGRYVNTVVDTAGLVKYDRKSIIVSGDDIDGNLDAVPTGAALTDIVNKMQTRGRQALDSQNRVTITRTDISNVAKYQYRKDYEVGDLISLDGNFGVIAVMRVAEYVEIEDENGETGHPTLTVPGTSL